MSYLSLDGPFGPAIDALAKGTLFLALLFLASPLLRKLSAGARHIVWGTGLVLLVAIPLLSRVIPWRIGVLPAAPVEAPAARGPRADEMQQAAPPTSTPDASTAAPETRGPATTFNSPSAATTSVTWPALDWPVVLLVVWAAGFLFFLGRLALAQWSADRLVRDARAVEGGAWEDAREWAAAHLGLERSPRVLTTDLLPLPVTTGLRTPVILLPVEAEHWTDVRRESVLLHEMAHVQRRDLVTNLLARVVCAAWWFHPLVWRALTRFRAESERAADDLVLAAGRRASDYAQDLLAVVQDAGRSRAPIHALAMAQRSDFEGRLLAILEPGASRRGVTPMTAIPLVLVVSLTSLPLAALGRARVNAAPDLTPTAELVPVVSAPEMVQRSYRTPAPAAMPSPTPSPTPSVPVTVVTPRVHVNVNVGGRAEHPASPQMIAELALALKDQDAEVRQEAARSLGQIGDTTAVLALTQALTNDTDEGVRRAAAWALGELEAHSAVPALITALKRDHDVEVRRNCAWALGQIEDASAVDALAAVLSDPDKELRQKAVWALGQIESDRAVPGLIAFLRDPDPDTRSQAAWALGQIESKSAVEGLSRAVDDSSADVRSHVAWALGQIQDAGSVPALSKLLRDPIADVRQQAAWALGQIQSRESVPALTQALRDDDADVRQKAVWALGQIQDAGSAAALAGALHDTDREVRKNAAWALGQLDLRQAPPALLDAFKDADTEVRKNAAWAAGQIQDPAAIPGLTALLTDGERDVVKNALWALGQYDDPRALDGVTRLLRSNDTELRRMAAQALGRGH